MTDNKETHLCFADFLVNSHDVVISMILVSC